MYLDSLQVLVLRQLQSITYSYFILEYLQLGVKYNNNFYCVSEFVAHDVQVVCTTTPANVFFPPTHHPYCYITLFIETFHIAGQK
jgi:hypothetical protein